MDVTLAPMVIDEPIASIKLPEDDSHIASNPNTKPQVLRELASSRSCNLRRLVAKNPNTPTDVLWQLGVDFPEAILENPIF